MTHARHNALRHEFSLLTTQVHGLLDLALWDKTSPPPIEDLRAGFRHARARLVATLEELERTALPSPPSPTS